VFAGGASACLVFAVVIHACKPLLFVMLPHRYFGGTQDRGEPPHVGAGAVRGSVLLVQTHWQAPAAPGQFVLRSPGAVPHNDAGCFGDGRPYAITTLALVSP